MIQLYINTHFSLSSSILFKTVQNGSETKLTFSLKQFYFLFSICKSHCWTPSRKDTIRKRMSLWNYSICRDLSLLLLYCEQLCASLSRSLMLLTSLALLTSEFNIDMFKQIYDGFRERCTNKHVIHMWVWFSYMYNLSKSISKNYTHLSVCTRIHKNTYASCVYKDFFGNFSAACLKSAIFCTLLRVSILLRDVSK